MTAIRCVEPVMGTVVSLEVHGAPAPAVDDALAWLHWVDRTFTTYDESSELRRLARGELRLEDCCPEMREVLELCEAARVSTHGCFSAVIDGVLDPSGLVKGWAVDRAAELLAAEGATAWCVNAGGDIALGGMPEGQPWRIGIADPVQRAGVAAVVRATDLAIATSGTAERGLHVRDPFTGRPATALASLTVVGPSLTVTDPLATAGLVMGDSARGFLDELDGVEALAITSDGRTWWTRGFPRLTGISQGAPRVLPTTLEKV